MYKLTYANNICGRKNQVRVGYPEHIVPDLCFYNENSPSHYLEMNSTVLVDALLNSKEMLSQLGLVVTRKGDERVPDYKHNNKDKTPPLNIGEADAPAHEAADSSIPVEVQEQQLLQNRIFTKEEKKILNKVTKEYAEEHGCSINIAKEYISQHLNEYLGGKNNNG